MSSRTISQLPWTKPSHGLLSPTRAVFRSQSRALQHSRTVHTSPSSPPTARRPQPTIAPIQRRAASSKSLGHDLFPPSHYQFFPQTFPKGGPPAGPFEPDLKALRSEYLALQARSHPDIAGPSAEKLSTLINEAYRTLQDPLRRAVYILAQHGVDVDDESAQLDDPELLMEVMEVRERVDEAESEEEVQNLREENLRRVRSCVQALETLFAQELYGIAAQETIKLRYWMNVDQSIQGWEQGKGGGAVHH